ncbi:MAG TPA: hypothetical protein VJS47_05420 [Rhizomicrobium sp.]|nr:hypothetical protein [Rhizomicrobium sp.]
MTRHIAALTLLSALASVLIASVPAIAWSPPVLVYFQPLKDSQFAPLEAAIREALSQPPLQLAAKPGPAVISISVTGDIETTRKRVSGNSYSFTVMFTRDGRSLGESHQSCPASKLSDCTDQLVLDVKTVAAR